MEILELVKKDPHTMSIPNIISLSRLLLLPFICYAISLQSTAGTITALILLCISGMSDFFDGYLARQLDQRSHLGRILDPLLDKISVGVLVLFLAAYRSLPYWYAFLVIGRDVLILIAAVSMVNRIKIVVESNWLGKWTLGSFLMVIVVYTLNWYPMTVVSMWISTILIPLTLISYFKRFKRMVTH
jgi:CDP-diacylglycerol--glycerol-3-phosphate 3-phosphatidyltransferase